MHRIYHPIVNCIFFLLAVVCSMIKFEPGYIIISLGSSLFMFFLLNGRSGIRFIAGILIACILIAVLNPIFNTRGEEVLFFIFGRPYTREALTYGICNGGIFASVILWFGCYNKCVSSAELLELTGRRLPSFSLTLVMALRLLPDNIRRIRSISGARRAIGMENGINEGMLRISGQTSYSLEHSIETTASMKSRGFENKKRSCYESRLVKLRDIILIAWLLVCLAAMLAGNVFNLKAVSYLFYIILLMTPSIITIKEDLKWKYMV